jgi:hypothetical protein
MCNAPGSKFGLRRQSGSGDGAFERKIEPRLHEVLGVLKRRRV